MDLYGFGFNGHGQIHDLSGKDTAATSRDGVTAPRIILHGRSIDILWSSWCDALISFQSSNPPISDSPPTIFYTGVNLTETQTAHVKNEAAATPHIRCFGVPLSDGLRGSISNPEPSLGQTSTLTLFASETDITSGSEEIETFPHKKKYRLQHVSLTTGGQVYVAADRVPTQGDAIETTEAAILAFQSLAEFKHAILVRKHAAIHIIRRFDPPHNQETKSQSAWKELLTNATTTAALHSNGKVFTWTTDRRYPKCLGREPTEEEPARLPSQIPYLSETEVAKIASGGYMTAALSSDGELFLWGQTCPGTEGELAILTTDEEAKADDEGRLINEEEDEYVRCVDIRIKGKPARVVDVAIGSGHIIVAAEREEGGEMSRAVFAAGQGENGQLGIGMSPKFVEKFVEVQSLRGLRVKQLAAAGWTSWVVVEDNEKNAAGKI